MTGGPAITIAQVDGPLRGATWLDDDTIVFATANGTTGLQRVAASGGEVTVLTRPDPKQRRSRPYLARRACPADAAVLFTITSRSGGPPQIALLDLETGDRKILVRGGTAPRYVESGHLVYAADGVLQAVPFDLRHADDAVARPCRCSSNSRCSAACNAVLDVATNGTLVYVPGSGTSRLPVWVDREGRETSIKGADRHVSDAAALA